MNLNQFYHYYKSKSGGEANLLKATEDFDSSIDWNKLPSTDAPTVSGGITDPNGGSDAQRINFTDNRQARVQQRVSLSASTQYTFSVYARVNTGTEQFRLRNVTLGEAEAKTATTSWTRFEYTFTTTTGGNYDLSIQNTSNDAKTIEFWGAMLNVGASANDYVKVDPSISGSTPTPAYSGFGDTYGDVTAYYSLRKFTEAETLNAIRVRRSSDDTEQDIGFDANGDLDSTALLAFVNEEITDDINTTTDSNADGLADGLTTHGNATYSIVTGNGHSGSAQRVDFNPSGGTLQTFAITTLPPIIGQEITISFMYRSNFTITSIGNGYSSAGTAFEDIPANTGDAIRFEAKAVWSPTGGSDGRVQPMWLRNSGEFIEISDWSVTYHTADGAVTTFYDQSGNGNNATNATASEQPLVVSGGTLVTENGKSAIDFDGTDDYLTLGGTEDAGMLGDISIFSVNKASSNSGVVIASGLTNSSSASFMQWGINLQTSNQYMGSTSDGTTRINESVTATNYGSQVLVSMINDEDGNLQMFADGVGSSGQTAVAPMNDAAYPLEIGRDPWRASLNFEGTQQELILFASDQSTNRTGIESNINDHFDIYP